MDSHVKSVDTDAKFHIHDKPGKDQDDPTPGSQAILHGHTRQNVAVAFTASWEW